MSNNEDIKRQWFEIMNSLASSKAHSDSCMTNIEGDRDKTGPKRQAELRRERKMNRVKRQRVCKKTLHKSHDNLLKKTDIVAILDRVTEYATSLRSMLSLGPVRN
ncbi:unnamed protein product [Cochlearia groenlandica]